MPSQPSESDFAILQDLKAKRMQPEEKISRVIDLRIPLPWLLGVAGVTVLFFFNMWATQNTLLKSVTDLEITVKSGNASMGTLTSEVALLKFRVSTNEDIMKQHSLLLQEKGRK